MGRLKEIELRGLNLFLAAAAARMVVAVLGAVGSPLAPRVGPWLLAASYLALLGALWVNRRLRPLWIVTLGVALNFFVVAANRGSMPVDRALAVRAGSVEMLRLLDSPNYTLHRVVTPQTRLRFLADVLPLPYAYPRPKWFCPGSVGDIFITLGACATLLWGMGALGINAKCKMQNENGGISF